MESQTIPELLREVFELDLGNFELTTVNRTYVLGDNHGRLYAEITSAEKYDQKILRFQLTARVRHEKDDSRQPVHSPMETLKQGHDWLIEQFLKLTNKQVRIDKWGSNE